MTLDDFLSGYPQLIGSVKNRSAIFFLGSGISRATPTYLRTAFEMSERLKILFDHEPAFNAYFDHTDSSKSHLFYPNTDIPRLEEIAEYFKYVLNEFHKFIDSLQPGWWEIEPPNACHEVLSEYLIEEFAQAIFTTNLDNQIETRHRALSPVPPSVIFHDDVKHLEAPNNNIFKLHGCLLTAYKYDTIWARRDLYGPTWPSSFSFGGQALPRLCMGKSVVFVGVATVSKFVLETLRGIVQANAALGIRDYYVVDLLPYSEYTKNSGLDDFTKLINLDPDHYIRLNASAFFNFVKHIVFKTSLYDIFANHSFLNSDQYQGGGQARYTLSKRRFGNVSEELIKEILKNNGVDDPSLEGKISYCRFQIFLRFILAFSGQSKIKDKYVSFKHQKDFIASVLRMLTLLRFNFHLDLATKKFIHLYILKDDKKHSITVYWAAKELTLRAIKSDIDSRIMADHELDEIKNVLVLDAMSYALGNDYSPSITQTDQHIGVVTPSYNFVGDDRILGSLDTEDDAGFMQLLDSIPWRI